MGVEPAQQIVAVPLDRIVRLSRFNPRQDMTSDVSDLAAMIKARGQQVPIKLRAIPPDDPIYLAAPDDAAVQLQSPHPEEPVSVSGLPEIEAGVSKDAATAPALETSALETSAPDPHQLYEVLDGGRRWRALLSIGDARDALAVIEPGDELAAREIALMISVSPKPLHPVDEYESFARLEEAGSSIDDIAAHFGESARHVRQRLALARLSPRLRDKWREGAIDREQAEAFAAGPIEAQEALLDRLAGQHECEWEAPRIRRALRGETLSNSGPEGKFLLADRARVEAYVAAGGRIDNDLFEDEIVIHDPILARRIVDDASRAEAERIRAAEGWGAALIEADGAYEDDEPNEIDFSDEENDRLEAIDDEQRQLSSPDHDDEDALEIDEDTQVVISRGRGAAERLRALDEERRAIITAALLRMIPPEERAAYAVAAFLDYKGRLHIARALPLAGANPFPSGEGGSRSEPGEGLPLSGDSSPAPETTASARPQPPIPDPLAEPGPALRAIIDAAASDALRDVTRRRGDIALMLGVARLGCQYGGGVVKLNNTGFDVCELIEDDDLLLNIAGARFADALDLCARASTRDLSVALFRLIAASIDTSNARFDTIGAVCAAVRARGGDLNAAFSSALDRRGFFEAAPKQITLGCVAGLIGEGEAGRVRKMKKSELADYVARLSKDKTHLPAPLADWAAGQELPDAGADAILTDAEPSLAEAMDQAISADAAKKAPAKKPRAPRKGKKTP